ncbi:hypothetical protein [Ideonella sp. A 288]|uniref:hypothetical protein n=1 Tax=Ideonella sp. A 288 TaxID=1962181 RepID=UPI000B4A6D63|nr:hypothetical protein [Ideonella sp. A 288]
MALDLALALAALLVAAALRPWRAVAASGPPWPWFAWWAALPLMWGADRYAAMPIVQPLSGAALLVMLAGWPLAMPALAAAALVTMAVGGLDAVQALHRFVWLGAVPATLALAGGAAVRRWLPHHMFIYILGRGFFITMLAAAAAGALALGLTGAPVGTDPTDVLLARWLSASGEAFITGMLVAIFVAFRPHWLATYSDRLYLRPPA